MKEVEQNKTIAAVRAKALESDHAINAVVSIRNDAAEATTRLRAALIDPRQSIDHANRFLEHIAGLNARLADAESFARKVCPDRLQQLDDEVAGVAERDRQERERAQAEHASAEAEARKQAEAAAMERMRQRQKRRDDEANLQVI